MFSICESIKICNEAESNPALLKFMIFSSITEKLSTYNDQHNILYTLKCEEEFWTNAPK